VLVVFDFVVEIAHAAVTLAAHETRARIGAPPEQPVEIGELARDRSGRANPHAAGA
jgi:hypothetical protein